jgi:hypothetical protein
MKKNIKKRKEESILAGEDLRDQLRAASAKLFKKGTVLKYDLCKKHGLITEKGFNINQLKDKPEAEICKVCINKNCKNNQEKVAAN